MTYCIFTDVALYVLLRFFFASALLSCSLAAIATLQVLLHFEPCCLTAGCPVVLFLP